LSKRSTGVSPIATQTALAAEELETEIGQLRATAWPAEIRNHVDELVTVSEKALEHWHQAAGARTRDDLIRVVVNFWTSTRTTSVTTNKASLGPSRLFRPI
jgi:hypothetical protein